MQGPLSKDIDEIEIHKREQPLIWREDIAVNATSVDGLMECRNSIQGRALIVDDEGFVCPRSNLMKNGCCQNTKKSKQYSCKSCNDDGCCGQYEYCVSCCLKPEKVCFHLYSLAAFLSINFENCVSISPFTENNPRTSPESSKWKTNGLICHR